MNVATSEQDRPVHSKIRKRLAHLPGSGNQQMNPAFVESAQTVKPGCRQPCHHGSVASG